MPIYEKINKVMKRVNGVEKSSKNTFGKYNYAGHEAVTAALRGHFAELGIVRSASVASLTVLPDGAVLAQCEVSYTDIEDLSAHRVSMCALQHCQTTKGGVTAQQVGQALSYAVKNVEFKLFALTGDTEADSDSTDSRGPEQSEPERSPELAQGLKDRAGELLTMFTRAKTIAEVDDIGAMVKSEWADLKAVKGFSEQVVAVRDGARKRLSVAVTP